MSGDNTVQPEKMSRIFQSPWWELDVPLPWRAKKFDHCVEISQPEGAGAVHISYARKMSGSISVDEILTQLKELCPEEAEPRRVCLGDFEGYSADYVDWKEGAFWKRWFMASKQIFFFASFVCKHGEENLELAQIELLLSSLRSRE